MPRVVVEFWRCEQHKALHFKASEQTWGQLKKMFAGCGYQIVERELKPAVWAEVKDCGIHRREEVLRSLFEVQGLEYAEGADITSAIESLILRYAETK